MIQYAPLKMNECPLKKGAISKGKVIFPTCIFAGDMLVFGGVYRYIY